jgi:hypothetical protein
MPYLLVLFLTVLKMGQQSRPVWNRPESDAVGLYDRLTLGTDLSPSGGGEGGGNP